MLTVKLLANFYCRQRIQRRLTVHYKQAKQNNVANVIDQSLSYIFLNKTHVCTYTFKMATGAPSLHIHRHRHTHTHTHTHRHLLAHKMFTILAYMYNNLTHEQTRVVIVKCISFWYIHVLIHNGCAH